MVAACRAAGVELMINWPTAWNPAIQTSTAWCGRAPSARCTRSSTWRRTRARKEIGCTPYFYNWLYDAKRNGAGALMDYCCYGADMAAHWLGRPEQRGRDHRHAGEAGLPGRRQRHHPDEVPARVRRGGGLLDPAGHGRRRQPVRSSAPRARFRWSAAGCDWRAWARTRSGSSRTARSRPPQRGGVPGELPPGRHSGRRDVQRETSRIAQEILQRGLESAQAGGRETTEGQRAPVVRGD